MSINLEKPMTYRAMGKDMWTKLKKNDPGLVGLCVIYTLAASLYPLLGVYLPRLLIAQIQQAAGYVWDGNSIANGASFANGDSIANGNSIANGSSIANGALIESLLASPVGEILRNMAVILVVYFVLAAVLGSLRAYVSNWSYSRLSYLRLDYLRDITRKVMTMDFKHYENAGFMDQVSRVNRAVQANNNGVEDVYRQTFLLPSLLISAVLLLGILSGAGIWLIVLPLVSFVAIFWAQNKSDQYRFDRREEASRAERSLRVYGNVAQDFTYGKDVRLYGLEGIITNGYQSMIDNLVAITQSIASKQFNYSLVPMVVQGISSLLTLGLLVARALAGTIDLASFTMYLTAYVSLNQIMQQIAESLNRISAEGRYVKEMINFLHTDLITEGGQKVDLAKPLTIEFKDVSFHYPGSDKLVLEHLNLTLNAGEKLALVGINGAGKSTIVKLLTGLHHPTEGQVLVNGVDTRELEQESLFAAFSVVFQEEKPMATTVAELVAGRSEGSSEGIDRDRVQESLQRAGLWEKISAEPKGIDTMLLKAINPDGLMLSGGETQKLMLARALYKDAPILLLDEPTASLDALAETAVYREFAEVMREKTGLFISHRLASTSFCDRIALLSGGKLTEVGTHAELMAKGAEYSAMFMTQGKYYQEESSDDAR